MSSNNSNYTVSHEQGEEMDGLKKIIADYRAENGLSGDEVFGGRRFIEWENEAFKVPLCALSEFLSFYKIPPEKVSEWWLNFQLKKLSHHFKL